jgi:hypothetical protein
MKRLNCVLCMVTVWAMISCGTASADATSTAQSAAGAVTSKFGSRAAMNSGFGQPLTTGSAMSTVDGSQQFTSQISCPSAQAFLQVVMFPDAQGDIQQLGVSIDTDFNGSYDQSTLFAGPYAGVCNNGVIQCDSGTFNNCTYWQWQASGSGVGLTQVAVGSLGACYCVNNACGSNLVWNNSQKVLADIGTGIANSMQATHPRLAISKSTYPDSATVVFYGSQAGCGTDTQPEQYYSNSTGLPTAGTAIAQSPTSDYYTMLQSPAAQGKSLNTQTCTRSRKFDVDNISKSNVVQLMSRSTGTNIDCGSGCIRFELGTVGDNYWSGGGCSLFSDQETIQISGSQYLSSATLVQTDEDDYIQVQVNGTVVWVDPLSWTNTSSAVGGSCETGRHATNYPNTDLTAFFNRDGSVNVTNHVSVGGNGEGWSTIEFHVNEGCYVKDTYIDDGCSSLEANSQCELMTETVDGVTVVQNYVATGLQPISSSKTVSGSGCTVGSVSEPWWTDQRVYSCKASSSSSYDFTNAVDAYNTVHQSFDPTTGNYTQRLVDVTTGAATLSQANVPLPPTQTEPACFLTCETMKPNAGVSVGDQAGAVNSYNTTGPANIYTWKQCTDAGACPTDVGETVAQVCDCHKNFAQAASMMQTIRMMQQDTICAPSP